MTVDRPAAEQTPVEWDFQLGIAATIARLLAALNEGRRFFVADDPEDRFPFLSEYRDRLVQWADGKERRALDPDFWDQLAADGSATATEHLPLRALCQAPFAGPEARHVVMTAALVEHDIRLGAVLASLQAPLNSRRPCIGLLGWLLGGTRRSGDVASTCERLAAAGVFVVENPDDPQAERVMRLPAPILSALEGHAVHMKGVQARPVSDAPTFDQLVLPTPVLSRVERLVELLHDGAVDAAVVRGSTGSGRRTVLRVVAAARHQGVLFVERGAEMDRSLGALALLNGSMLVHVVEPGLGETVEVMAPPEGVTPLGVVSGPTGGVRIPGMDRLVVIDLPVPRPQERLQFWTRSGLPATPEVVHDVAARFALSGGHIGRVASTAKTIAELDRRDYVSVTDIQEAARTLGRQSLETLASLLPPLGPVLAPVLTGDIRQEFDALVLRCRRREALASSAAPALAASMNRGVRAMFSGPSGTGKTLAARSLAARLDLDVYRVDLAAVVDKYIGESERRLNQVFARAEELGVVLLLDEGDAFMTRRTDVRTANDRYANLETNYLLQRLESYEGIVVVTTNAANVIDSAFLRRLDVVIAFSPPSAAERLEIWLLHLPELNAVTSTLLEQVVRRCELTGGQIRNAALHAALMAHERRTQIDDEILAGGVTREYRRAGLTSPLTAPADPAPTPFEQALGAVGAIRS